ncbi:MAG: type VI secretion system baseplate subunit TssG, partial [Plesiomonas shigelloides]
MAGADRSALHDVMAQDDAPRFNFFQLVEVLSRLEQMDLEAETDRLPAQEKIRFKSAASLGFPASDVLQVSQDEVGRHQLEVAFLGLHGSQSPMPGYYLDDLA